MNSGADKVTLSAMTVPPKHESLNLDPCHSCKKLGTVACACNPNTGSGDRWMLVIGQLAKLNQ